jgi:hypothetical protein
MKKYNKLKKMSKILFFRNHQLFKERVERKYSLFIFQSKTEDIKALNKGSYSTRVISS